jgi:translation initiation factor eIF-2B subunit epsilon
LALFTENFDYQDIQNDFIKGVLDSELLGKNIHCQILREGYACCPTNMQMYKSITNDLLKGWVFPLCRELFEDYQLVKYSCYLGKNCVLDPEFLFTSCTMIGHDSVIGSSVIDKSVIGRNCVIGKS